MHKLFSDWYREAKIDPKEEWLSKRWEGIEKFSDETEDLSEWLELIRIFYLKETQDKNFLESYIDVFQSIDSTFPRRENKVEISLLAGATVLYYIENHQSEKACALALATVCLECQGIASHASVSSIWDEISKYLYECSTNIQRDNLVPDIGELVFKNLEVPDNEEEKEEESELIEKDEKILLCLKDIEKKFALTQQVIRVLDENQRSQLEETNILWWVLGEYSRDLEKPMSRIDFSVACILSGKELADLVTIMPGPVAAEAFLDKMISFPKAGTEKEISIKDAVNRSPVDWKKKLIGDIDDIGFLRDFCPILCAIEKSIEADDADGWISVFKKVSTINADSKIEPIKLAIQMYRESLLVRLVKEWG